MYKILNFLKSTIRMMISFLIFFRNIFIFFWGLPSIINYHVKYSIYPRYFQITKESNSIIGPYAEFLHGYNISIGSFSTILHKSFIWAGYESKIKIGNYVMIGPNVLICSFNHGTKELGVPYQKQKYYK